jgi:tRNA(Met) cytidine acetyltransferase
VAALFTGLKAGRLRVYVTAPEPSNLDTFYTFLLKGLEAAGIKRELVREAGITAGVKTPRGFVRYFRHYDPPPQGMVDLVVVDEAAGIPVNLLFEYLSRYDRLVYSTTVHGYEGAGRGFEHKFTRALRARPPGRLVEVQLGEPIRYALGDPVERWLYETLLLDAEPPELGRSEIAEIKAERCAYRVLDLDRLFEAEEDLLRAFIGTYVTAHYRNKPNDLAILGDAPHHHARALMTPAGKLVVALHLAEEGGLNREMIQQVLEGEPPPGQLIPSLIVKYYPPYRRIARLKGWRVVRIATHPELTGRGLGSETLSRLKREAEEMGLDWVGASFGASPELVAFWDRNGFLPIHLSPMRNITSGEYSLVMVYPFTTRARKGIVELNREFRARLVEALSDPYFNLEVSIARILLKGVGRERQVAALTRAQRERLGLYIKGHISYEGATDCIRPLTRAYFLSTGKGRAALKPVDEELLVARVLQGKSWKATGELVGMSSGEVKAKLRELVGEVASHHLARAKA